MLSIGRQRIKEKKESAIRGLMILEQRRKHERFFRRAKKQYESFKTQQIAASTGPVFDVQFSETPDSWVDLGLENHWVPGSFEGFYFCHSCGTDFSAPWRHSYCLSCLAQYQKDNPPPVSSRHHGKKFGFGRGRIRPHWSRYRAGKECSCCGEYKQ